MSISCYVTGTTGNDKRIPDRCVHHCMTHLSTRIHNMLPIVTSLYIWKKRCMCISIHIYIYICAYIHNRADLSLGNRHWPRAAIFAHHIPRAARAVAHVAAPSARGKEQVLQRARGKCSRANARARGEARGGGSSGSGSSREQHERPTAVRVVRPSCLSQVSVQLWHQQQQQLRCHYINSDCDYAGPCCY